MSSLAVQYLLKIGNEKALEKFPQFDFMTLMERAVLHEETHHSVDAVFSTLFEKNHKDPSDLRILRQTDLRPLILFAEGKTPDFSEPEPSSKSQTLSLHHAYGKIPKVIFTLLCLDVLGHPKARDALKNLETDFLVRSNEGRKGLFLALTVLAGRNHPEAVKLLTEKAAYDDSVASILGEFLNPKSATDILGTIYSWTDDWIHRSVISSDVPIREAARQALSTAAKTSLIAARYLPPSERKPK